MPRIFWATRVHSAQLGHPRRSRQLVRRRPARAKCVAVAASGVTSVAPARSPMATTIPDPMASRPFGRRHGRLWRGSFLTSQPHSRTSTADGENAPRQDMADFNQIHGISGSSGIQRARCRRYSAERGDKLPPPLVQHRVAPALVPPVGLRQSQPTAGRRASPWEGPESFRIAAAVLQMGDNPLMSLEPVVRSFAAIHLIQFNV